MQKQPKFAARGNGDPGGDGASAKSSVVGGVEPRGDPAGDSAVTLAIITSLA
jgi:hypothetical protein